jgi:hypothetical protein
MDIKQYGNYSTNNYIKYGQTVQKTFDKTNVRVYVCN